MSRPVEPRPLPQRQLKTVFLRVPSPQWGGVSGGRVREFRVAAGNAPQLSSVPTPMFAVLYRRQPARRPVAYKSERRPGAIDYRLMLLERTRLEALGAITEEGLRLAGYQGDDAWPRFRRDWCIAEKRRFEPLRKVVVYTVRPIQPDDLLIVGEKLVDHLFGSYLEEAQARAKTIIPQTPSDRAPLAGRAA